MTAAAPLARMLRQRIPSSYCRGDRCIDLPVENAGTLRRIPVNALPVVVSDDDHSVLASVAAEDRVREFDLMAAAKAGAGVGLGPLFAVLDLKVGHASTPRARVAVVGGRRKIGLASPLSLVLRSRATALCITRSW